MSQERKMSLSDRFGTIKQTPTLQEKAIINSNLVKRLQLKISNVVKSRDGNEVVESLADKIGKEERECIPQRLDDSLNVESSKFQNIKVQVTLNAKRFSEQPARNASESTFQNERGNRGSVKENSLQNPSSKTFHNQPFGQTDNWNDKHASGPLNSVSCGTTASSYASSKGIFNNKDPTHLVANEAIEVLHHKTSPVKVLERDPSKPIGNGCYQKDLEFQQCFPLHLHSKPLCKPNSDSLNPEYKSPLVNNYIQPANNYDSIPFAMTKADPKCQTPCHYQQSVCYKDQNITTGNANHNYAIPIPSRENKIEQNGRSHSSFGDRAIVQGNFENYHNQALKFSPSQWRNRTPQKSPGMPYKNFGRGNFDSQNIFKFTGPNRSNIPETSHLHQNIDMHTGYYGSKRRSPFKPDKTMIPAKKRMINEYFNQISDQEMNHLEHVMPVANKQNAGMNNALFPHDPRQNVVYQGFTENVNTVVEHGNRAFSLNNGQLDNVRRALNMDVTSCEQTPTEKFETDAFNNMHSIAATKQYPFNEMFLKEKNSERNNRPTGFYRELSKENQSPEKEGYRTMYDSRRNGSHLKQLVDTSEVKEKLVDTLLMQCQGLVEKENDKKALEAIFNIIQKETSVHFSDTNSSTVKSVPKSCGSTEDIHKNQDTNIEMNFYRIENDKSEIGQESRSKELDDNCVLKKQNLTNKTLDKIPDVQSKFSPTLSSPDYYAKPNSSMKFEGRTLLKGGVDPRHIPKNVMEKFIKNPPLDPRGSPKSKNHKIDLPLPLFFVEFIAGVKEKKSEKDLSIEIPKKVSEKLSKSENESSVDCLKSENRCFHSKPAAEINDMHYKRVEDNEDNKTVDNLNVVEMEIDDVPQDLAPKAIGSNPDIFDTIDLVLQAAQTTQKSICTTSDNMQRSELKPCDPRLNVCTKDGVKNFELKTLKYNKYPDGCKSNDPVNASSANEQNCKFESHGTARDADTDKRRYEEAVKYKRSGLNSPKRSFQRHRTFSRDSSKYSSRDDSPKYRAVDKIAKCEQAREMTSYQKMNGRSNPCPRGYSQGYSSHAPRHDANSAPRENTSRFRKEWSGEVIVVETKSRSTYEKYQSSCSKKDVCELKDLSPDTCKFIKRRENDRKRLPSLDYRHDESRGKFRHDYQGHGYLAETKLWTPKHAYR